MEQQFQSSGERSTTESPAPGTAAIDRGAGLLVRVLEASEPVSLGEIAAQIGIPKSTASRLVSALERHGLVEQDGERGRLRPGPAIVRVAERGLLERNLIELARPTLEVLAELSGETINLAVPGLTGVEHIAQVDSRHFLGAGKWVGRAVHYHSSANGKVFLAFGRAPMPETLQELTPATITDPRRLLAELETIRASGLAITIDELEPGLAAIAAPVYGAHGDVIAAVSVTGPTLRMSPPRIAELRAPLILEARRLSERLGNREQGEKAA
jgi:DNA-binding IclR family transcriptional regulator